MTRPRPDRKHPLVNANDAAVYFLQYHGVRVKPTAIRQWAARKKIGSHSFRRERYDIREIEDYARRIGVIPRSPESASR